MLYLRSGLGYGYKSRRRRMRRYLTIIILFLSITGVAFSQVPPPFILPPAIPYPAGSGIPIVSGGMSWGTTLGVGTLTDTKGCTYTTANGLVCNSVILPATGTAFKLAAYTAANTLGELAAVGGVGEVLIGNFGAIPSFSSSPLVATLTAASANSITVGADSASSGPAIGSVIFHNATNTNHFQILSGTTLAALSWTLPTAAPLGENYLVTASTTGVLTYSATSANMLSLLASADYATARTNLSLGNVENTALSTWAGTANVSQLASTIIIGTTGNKIICAAGVCGVYLNDGVTLARFNMGLLVITGFDGTAATAGNIKPMSASTASGVVTLGALHFETDADLLTYGDGAAAIQIGRLSKAATWSGQQTFVAPVLGAATATSLVATGRVDGTVGVLKSTANSATTVVVATHGSSSYFLNIGDNAAHSIFTLPVAATGLQYCFRNYVGITQVLTVQTDAAGTQGIDLDGTATADNGFIHSGGAAGDAVCVVGISATEWIAYPSKGTWTRD
jgi:hypothetical protein